jgi:DNA ligase-associated metallophosphoesterase
VGDFFHTHNNSELDWFKKWRADLATIKIILVKGNHDILKKDWYVQANIEVVDNELLLYPFLFIHEQCEDRPGTYTFCGHLHPGIVLDGLAKQSLRFPCFYFTNTHAVLPAFSEFTGMAIVRPKEDENVFAIVEEQLVQLQ